MFSAYGEWVFQAELSSKQSRIQKQVIQRNRLTKVIGLDRFTLEATRDGETFR